MELSLLIALVAGEAIDSLARPRRAPLTGSLPALVWRGAIVAAIWLLAFGLTARPLFALAATAVTVAVLVAVSDIKQRFMREPLVFSDLALLQHALKHPELFYVKSHWRGAALAGIAGLIAVIAIWLTIEPRTATAAGQFAALLGFAVVLVAPFAPLSREWLAASAAQMVPSPEPQDDLARLGLLTSLAAYFVRWLAEDRPAAAERMPVEPASDVHAVVVIQAEAFADLRRLGYDSLQLPSFDRLKRRALASGLIEVACQGGYTLRPESALLTGVGFDAQGFDRFHPYLRPQRWSPVALPGELSEAGWATEFVHPYDPAFFRRDRAMAELGFATFADDTAFATAERTGPYVSDNAVADHVIGTLRRHDKDATPVFIFAATMEAHEPYEPGRLPGEDDPVRQYVQHIENADRMLGRIADALGALESRTLLVFYGDHVPLLPGFADPFSDIRTDYLVVEFGGDGGVESEAVSRPEHLTALIRAWLRHPNGRGASPVSV